MRTNLAIFFQKQCCARTLLPSLTVPKHNLWDLHGLGQWWQKQRWSCQCTFPMTIRWSTNLKTRGSSLNINSRKKWSGWARWCFDAVKVNSLQFCTVLHCSAPLYSALRSAVCTLWVDFISHQVPSLSDFGIGTFNGLASHAAVCGRRGAQSSARQNCTQLLLPSTIPCSLQIKSRLLHCRTKISYRPQCTCSRKFSFVNIQNARVKITLAVSPCIFGLFENVNTAEWQSSTVLKMILRKCSSKLYLLPCRLNIVLPERRLASNHMS